MDESSTSSYYIQTVSGSDGPYDLDRLQRLLALGRLSPEDRLLSAGDLKVVAVTALIPDAAQIYRRAASDRVVRKSSDRLQIIAERQRTPLPLPIAAPVEEPVAATEQPERRSTSVTPLPAAPTVPPKLNVEPFKGAFLTIFILSVIAILVWSFPLGKPDSGPFPVPDIPALTATELANLPEQELLHRIETECMRRMLVSGMDLRVANSILSPPARHLLTLIGGENVIQNFGILEQLRIERDPTLGTTRPLASMIEAYQALGMERPAQLLTKALALPATQAQAIKEIESQYYAAINQNSKSKLIAYAKSHRPDLFPDLVFQPGTIPKKGP